MNRKSVPANESLRVEDPAVEIDGVVTVSAGIASPPRSDEVAHEEPLEMRVAGLRVSVTMRTPGNDFDLVTGFLLTEGILREPRQIDSMAYCPDEGTEGLANIVNVNLANSEDLDPARWQRNFYASSSCGVCGKASIDSIRLEVPPISDQGRISAESLIQLQTAMDAKQPVFARTGGLHAAALGTVKGELIAVREDIGRHNAVDKVIGASAKAGEWRAPDRVLLVSGRASFEIVQKAAMAGIGAVAAVSAPSSLAVGLARATGITLIGFFRHDRFNVYTRIDRIALSR